MTNRTTYGPTMLDPVYATLADNPASTSQEIAKVCGVTVNQASKSIAELVSTGRAAASGKRPCNVTRRWMTQWRVRA